MATSRLITQRAGGRLASPSSLTSSSSLLGAAPPRRTFMTAAAAAGAGGRASYSGVTATVFGCSGFLGRYVVNRLGRVGSQIVCPSRSGEMGIRHLKVMGDLGQVIPLDFDLKNDDSIRDAIHRSNLVINCMGKFWDSRNFTLEHVHAEGPARIARLCREMGVERMIHVSALGADPNAECRFLSSKGKGEEMVREEFPDATIVRPALMIGPEDKILNWYAQMMRNYGWQPAFFNDNAQMRPILATDAAAVINELSFNPEEAKGNTFEVYGPEVWRQSDLIELVSSMARYDSRIINLNSFLSKLLGRVCDKVPDLFVLGDFSYERTRIFQNDILPSGKALTAEDAGVAMRPITQGKSWLSMWRTGTPFDMQPKDS